jgi:hypothetical protein
MKMQRMALMFGFLAAAGCNPFDPELGERPFKCGTDAPRCPDGYDAVDVTQVRCECIRQTGGGGGDYDCNADTAEPNNTTDNATSTAIGPGTSTVYNDLAVCPATDIDTFELTIGRSGTTINVQVDFDPMRVPPDVDILNSNGVSVQPTVNSIGVGRIIASERVESTGKFYAQVLSGSASEGEANYSIRMTVDPP